MSRSASADPVVVAVSEALSRVRTLYADAQAFGAAQTELAAIAGALQRALDLAGTTRTDAGQVRFESEMTLRHYGRRNPLIGSLLIQLWLREGAAILSDRGLDELLWLLETSSSDPSPPE